jgi:hypothetical protein
MVELTARRKFAKKARGQAKWPAAHRVPSRATVIEVTSPFNSSTDDQDIDRASGNRAMAVKPVVVAFVTQHMAFMDGGAAT